ncbi:MAG: methyltransferase [Planctomycetes bacterium]|nr:methyltransferase [Planctomycetota bacterium]
MRIVAGKFRRRKLLSRSGLDTRPIPDRVKEMLFARLEDEVLDARVADIFAGTGTIGLEALSRGARSVVFVEKDRRAFELLRKNVASLGVQEQCLCWCTDVLHSSLRPKGVEPMLPYDVVFVDPPFDLIGELKLRGRLYRPMLRLARDTISSSSALLILRTPRRADFQMPEVWQPVDPIRLNNMEIHLFRKAKDSNEEVTSS